MKQFFASMFFACAIVLLMSSQMCRADGDVGQWVDQGYELDSVDESIDHPDDLESGWFDHSFSSVHCCTTNTNTNAHCNITGHKTYKFSTDAAVPLTMSICELATVEGWASGWMLPANASAKSRSHLVEANITAEDSRGPTAPFGLYGGSPVGGYQRIVLNGLYTVTVTYDLKSEAHLNCADASANVDISR